MRILYMGTPDIAVLPLEAIINSSEQVAAVVTQTDKPQGRKMILTPPPVKVYAEAHGIPVYQPQTFKNGGFERELHEIDPELIVVVAYGKLLPDYVLEYPRYGCINAHGSLLPKYRGAAPMQRAIMDGESESGMCAMYMASGMDTGDVIDTERVSIGINDDFGVFHDNMAAAASTVLLRAIRQIRDGTVTRTPQNDAAATYAPKIEAADCLLDFSLSSRQLHNRIRALSPAPLTHAKLNGRTVKLISSDFDEADSGKGCGEVVSTDGGKIAVGCGSGTLYITGVLPEGKKRQSAADFIRGRGVSIGDVFTRE